MATATAPASMSAVPEWVPSKESLPVAPPTMQATPRAMLTKGAPKKTPEKNGSVKHDAVVVEGD